MADWPAAGKQAGELLRAREGLPRSCSHSAWRLELSHWPLARSGALCSLTYRKRPANSRHMPLAVWRGRNRRAGGRLFSSVFRAPARVATTRRHHILAGPGRPPRAKLVCGPPELHRVAEAGNRPNAILRDRCGDPRPAARQPARRSPASKMTQSPLSSLLAGNDARADVEIGLTGAGERQPEAERRGHHRGGGL
jgi:hypothetical protein